MDRVRTSIFCAVASLITGLLFAPLALAQDNPWPTEREARVERADAGPASDKTPADAPLSAARPTQTEPTAGSQPDTAEAAPLLLQEIDGVGRYLLVLLVLLAAYLVPALAYPTLLRSSSLSPGRAAGACLATGALLIAFPGVMLLLARAEFSAGVAVPWYQQVAHLPAATACAGALLGLAALAWRTRGSRDDA